MSTTHTQPFVLTPKWWLDHPGMNGNRLSVLVILASFTRHDDRTCFPSQSTIADLLGRSRAWVNKIIRELEEYGLIQKTQRKRTNNDGTTSCLYRVRMEIEGDDASSSENLTGGVKNIDTNNNQNKYKTLSEKRFFSENEILEWSPGKDVISAILSLMPDCNVDQYSEKFRKKLIKRGYQYEDLDTAFLTWFHQDHEKGLVPSTAKAKPVSDSNEIKHSVETIRQSLGLDQDRTDYDFSERLFMDALDWIGETVGWTICKNWFSNLSVGDVSEREIVLHCGSKFEAGKITQDYMAPLEAALTRVGLMKAGQRVTIKPFVPCSGLSIYPKDRRGKIS